MFGKLRTFTTRQIASWRDFRFVTTSIWPALTALIIRKTPPCGNTIIVVVCSSKGSVCCVTSDPVLTREP